MLKTNDYFLNIKNIDLLVLGITISKTRYYVQIIWTIINIYVYNNYTTPIVFGYKYSSLQLFHLCI